MYVCFHFSRKSLRCCIGIHTLIKCIFDTSSTEEESQNKETFCGFRTHCLLFSMESSLQTLPLFLRINCDLFVNLSFSFFNRAHSDSDWCKSIHLFINGAEDFNQKHRHYLVWMCWCIKCFFFNAHHWKYLQWGSYHCLFAINFPL